MAHNVVTVVDNDYNTCAKRSSRNLTGNFSSRRKLSPRSSRLLIVVHGSAGDTRRMRSSFAAFGLLALTFTLAACGGESGDTDEASADGGSTDGGSTDGGGTDSGGTDSGGRVPVTPPTGDWKSAFAADSAGVTCDMTYDDMKTSGAPNLKFGDTEIFVGFQQYGNNQDPVFRRFDKGVEAYCEHHEKESPDGRAYGITWNGGDTAYVVYSIVGGGSAFDGKGQGQWVSHYGDGGASSAVSFIGVVEVAFGTLQKGTFVVAKRQSGTKTNTLRPNGAITVLSDGGIEFQGVSAYSPLNPDLSPMCEGSVDYPKGPTGADDETSYILRLASDLKSATCATTWGCSKVVSPCK